MKKYLFISMVIFLLILIIFIRKSNQNVLLPSKGYLINLEKRNDRLKEFMKNIKKSDLNIHIERVPAINGKLLDPTQINMTDKSKKELLNNFDSGFRTKHYELTVGAIGCYLSHIQVWNKILENDDECAFVFEDDAYIPENFAHKTKELLKIVPKFDILMLGIKSIKSETLVGYKKVKKFWWTHSYIITKSCIKKILTDMLPISQQIDSQLSDLSNKIVILAPIRNISTQNTYTNKTDIQSMPVKRTPGVNPFSQL